MSGYAVLFAKIKLTELKNIPNITLNLEQKSLIEVKDVYLTAIRYPTYNFLDIPQQKIPYTERQGGRI